MDYKNIKYITAITEVRSDGQKCVRAVITYAKAIEEQSVRLETFKAENRTITGVACEDNQVILQLDPNDEAAATFHEGSPWEGIPATLAEASVAIQQVRDIKSVDGEMIAHTDEYIPSTKTHDDLVDSFIQMSYGRQKYNLYIPRDYDANKKYPLVQFIHDAAAGGSDTRLALTQGVGALVWVMPEFQRKHPCFIFAPQFDAPPIVDDEWNVDPRLEDAKAALDNIVDIYSVDRDRIYTTGQSMGCMASIVLNVRYPEYFAASYLVAGQWDERNIPNLEKQKLWMLCSQGDAKAFPIMNQMCVAMEKAGAKVTRRVMEAGLTDEEYAGITDEIMKENPDIIFTPYKLETVAEGWHSFGGEHHVYTWRTAYDIDVIREWMFRQHRGA